MPRKKRDFKTDPKTLALMLKEKTALEMRLAGKTYDIIAQELGYSSYIGALKAVQRAMTRTISEPAEQLRLLENSRLDAILESIWDMVRSGDLEAIDRVIKIAERRAKLLGLDAPNKLELGGSFVDLAMDLLRSGQNTSSGQPPGLMPQTVDGEYHIVDDDEDDDDEDQADTEGVRENIGEGEEGEEGDGEEDHEDDEDNRE